MTDNPGMPEYRQGDVVRLTVTVRDPHGVQVVYARARREEAETEHPTNYIRLEGVPLKRGYTPELVELAALVTTETPGVYVCTHIQAFDMLGFKTDHPLEPPKRFRIVESPEDDREGPEVLDVGEFS